MKHLISKKHLYTTKLDIRATHPFQWLKLTKSGNTRTLSLLISDVLAIGFAWKIANFLNQFYSPIPKPLVWWVWLGLPSIFWIFSTTTLLLFAYRGLYGMSVGTRNYVEAGKLVSYAYLLLLVTTYFLNPTLDLPRSLFLTAWCSSVSLVVLFRLTINFLIVHLISSDKPVTIFLIARAERLKHLSEVIKQRSQYKIVGAAIASTANSETTLKSILATQPQEVLAEDLPHFELASNLFWHLRRVGIPLRLLPSSRDMMYHRGISEVFAGFPTLRIETSLLRTFDYRLKRWMDFLLAAIGVILLIPVFGLIAIAIKLDSPGPIFFRQERTGLHGKVFQVWKFRTMVANAPKLQQQLESDQEKAVLFKLHNDPRIIPIGHFLRRTSLDELPQLYNVLLGQMSLVGPRPLPLRDTAMFEQWHHIRHQVLPGITGLWQISGRSDIEDFDDAARLDLHYIDNWSLNLDLEILLETIKIVCLRKGAY